MNARQFGLLCFAVTCIALISSAAPISAAENAEPGPTINLELKDTDVRSAIEALFRGTGKNYAIDANVTGTISALSIKDVSFDTALRSLTKSAGLVYRQDGGVYIISMRPQTETTAAAAGTGAATAVADTTAVDETTATEVRIEKIPLSNVSASEILAILQGNYNTYGYGAMNVGRYGSNYGMGYGMMGYGAGYGNYGYGNYGNYGYGNYGNYGNYGYNRGYGNYGSGYNTGYGYGGRGYGYSGNFGYGGGYRPW